jgi:L-aspartate oxidase
MRIVEADAVVVGSGVAGFAAVLALPPGRVALLTKGRAGHDGCSELAQGGMAAAVGPDDAPARHAADTLAVGAGLADPRAVAVVTESAPGIAEALLRLGVPFDHTPGGALALGREGGHSRRRILHADGDATGRALVRTLGEAVAKRPDLEVEESAFAAELVMAFGRVAGVVGLDGEGTVTAWLAPAVILATGGVGRLYAATTNPPPVTGDGLAMAARAGALLADLEMVQFHPTALAGGRDPLPLLTEALRGEGAVLVDGAGRRFMVEEDPRAELAPRDVVARAIGSLLEAGERVYLDATRAVGTAFPERFPTVWRHARDAGLDPRSEPLPVSPAAHYHMGGVVTDLWGRTSLPGLWACGEVACTGLHGGNRLASNSLLEGLVFGRRVGEAIGRERSVPRPLGAGSSVERAVEGWVALTRQRVAGGSPAVRELMSRRVGLVRDAAGLDEALDELTERARRPRNLEERNLLLAGRLIAAAALRRRESRGGHYRRDFPEPAPQASCRLVAAAAELLGEGHGVERRVTVGVAG